ncbi:MAG: hypothetical protein ACE5KK_07860 [Candidatus Brocadiales bacterium]
MISRNGPEGVSYALKSPGGMPPALFFSISALTDRDDCHDEFSSL